MVDIIHRIGIDASPDKVFTALATVDGVAGWWTRHTSGESKLGGVMTVRFVESEGGGSREKGRMDLSVTRLDPGREVRWKVTAGPTEWIDTDVTFELSTSGSQTIVAFGHRGWREAVDFTAHCSMKWATFLLSLRDFVQTGHGQPSPEDVKVDDWN